MADTPAVSVIMPVFNAAPFVAEAIESILAQTFQDLVLIIINDGSTDGSGDVIRRFDDPRIHYLEQSNQGIAAALNAGIALSRAPLIARQDADDVSLPERIGAQVTFLRTHPEVGIVGTWATVVDPSGRPKGALEHPTAHAAIEFELLFNSPFAHPSVMFRKDVLDKSGLYDGDPRIFEDFDMWSRMLRHTKGANLPKHLIRYRDVPTSLMNTSPKVMARLMVSRRRNIAHYLPGLHARTAEVLASIGNDHPLISREELKDAFGALARFVENLAPAPDLHERLMKLVRRRLMSFHVIQHTGLFNRAMDKVLKTIVLQRAVMRSGS